MSPPTTPAAPAPDRRLEKALLTFVRQEFSAPVATILGFAEIMLEDAAGQGVGDASMDDLRRIHAAGLQLKKLVDDLLDPQVQHARMESADIDSFRGKLRHDLRTPINAIKGYGEMLLEDAQDGGFTALGEDLGKLLAAAQRLLAQIDALVEFGQGNFNPMDDAASARADDAPKRTAQAAIASGVLEKIRALTSATDHKDTPPARILVVDDTAANRDLLSRRLGRDGHQVTVADGGRAALALIGESDFDLILLDLMMPDISGYELLCQLKTDPAYQHIPVIMISAFDEIDSVVRCIEAGAEDYLSKPFNPVLLQARLAASLEKKRLRDREKRYIAELKTEMERSEALLLNILPKAIMERMHQGENIADRFREVTVLFSDLVGFTALASRMSPAALVDFLNSIFSTFDRLSIELGVEKIKTIGDAYMVVAGLPEPRADHAQIAARMALAMREAVAESRRQHGEDLQIRIGLHTGAVVAGIIGTHKFVYDVWGDTVNTASRMESHGIANEIQVSAATHALLVDGFLFQPRGTLKVKGKGMMETFLLRGERAAGTA